jgi:hypothetical protein
MNRRSFLRNTSLAAVALTLPLMLTGCTGQTITIVLLSELLTAWTGFEAALGKTVPSSVTAAFNAAIAAVNAWVPGTPIQDVVQALQVLSNDVAPLLASAFPVEVAAAEVVLGTIVNLIEFIDPASVPPVAATALAQANVKTYVRASQVSSFNFKTYAAQKAVEAAKAKFEKDWKAATGKAA